MLHVCLYALHTLKHTHMHAELLPEKTVIDMVRFSIILVSTFTEAINYGEKIFQKEFVGGTKQIQTCFSSNHSLSNTERKLFT